VMKKLVCLAALVMCMACSGQPQIAGRYEASHSGLSGQVQVVMVLGEDGSGKWETGGELIHFSWTADAGAVSVHTREGAVIEGKTGGGRILLDVPGVGELQFVPANP